MQTWALMYAHPAILEETRRRGVHPWISTGRQMRAPDPEGQVTVIAVALARKTVGGIGLNVRRRSVGRMLVLAGEASSPVPLPQSVRTFA
jgi:CelD/BcsL family acetyltransferase involved in cellulose biosynthesis